MGKRTISILALILTFLAATAAAAETWYIQTDNGKPLNIRSGPSQTSGIIATAENGIPLEVVELLEDGTWAKVVYHNQTGYCMTTFLTRDQEPEGSDLGYSIVYDESLFSYEQAGGIDTYWWKAQEPGKPNCYLSVSRLTGYTLDEAMEGLILQSGFEGTRSTLVLDGQVASTFTFAEGTDADDAVTQYVCVPLSDGSILLVEISYYVAAKETAGQALQEMLHSITFSTPENVPKSNSSAEYAQCPDCGQWFETGNVFRNHLCPAREAAEAGDADSTEYVQCDICGEWFRAGNEFRNHLCVTYPDEDNLDDEISIVEDYPEA